MKQTLFFPGQKHTWVGALSLSEREKLMSCPPQKPTKLLDLYPGPTHHFYMLHISVVSLFSTNGGLSQLPGGICRVNRRHQPISSSITPSDWGVENACRCFVLTLDDGVWRPCSFYKPEIFFPYFLSCPFVHFGVRFIASSRSFLIYIFPEDWLAGKKSGQFLVLFS